MQLITIQQFASSSTNIIIEEQTTKIKNYNVIISNLRNAREIVNNNKNNCANQFNNFFEVCALYLLR